ncbi:MAG: AAA family ATPase [Candidatus Abyssobacteria bacterium SURF_17]|uniref:AAA family ATPase n=1 Tax=Candidatus Abyssobacteria bacterium SURF_17 TaxID=2093361 RepID=A0A419EWW4_9BACT|nr:MAG: AAA family ATPase [Candidatus Abyssubacteria bacterium SURF_17]
MYESFFGFKEKPFNITPDPKYLYLSDQHQEAIAHLLYGIRERGGFVVVSGEIGTGKTTLCRYLLNQMDDRTEGAIVFNPNLSEIELLKSINEDFGIISTGQTKKELIDELNQFLLEERLRGKNMVLIIDEAQNLHPAVLEQVRMLSNLETEKEKLIQIVLIGQPQLKKLLAKPELRQLDQRVTARYHLRPLSRKETYAYIEHRLAVASNNGHVAFEPTAMKLVYRFSKGIPRLINVVCDRALLGAFAAGQPSPIPKRIVKQAIREIVGPKYSLRDKFTLDKASGKLFVYSFVLTLVAVLGWYSITTLGSLPAPRAAMKELIPDSPQAGEQQPSSFLKADVGTAAVESTAGGSSVVESGQNPGAAVDSAVREKGKELAEVLLSAKYDESRLRAVQNLLLLWGSNSGLTQEDVRSFYSLAGSRQMRCTELWTNFEGLRSLNVPCLLEMFVPQEMRPRYVVLAGLDGSTAKILHDGAQMFEVPLDVVDEFWLRRAFVFWKDFEQLNEILQAGDTGRQVAWLQTGLQTLGLFGGPVTGSFDAATEEAVRAFQQQGRLLLDGVVGPRTRLALYASLRQYSMPRLDDKGHEHNT